MKSEFGIGKSEFGSGNAEFGMEYGQGAKGMAQRAKSMAQRVMGHSGKDRRLEVEKVRRSEKVAWRKGGARLKKPAFGLRRMVNGKKR